MGLAFLRSSVAACLWLMLVSAAPGYRLVEPFPRVSLEVPAGWQEHRRADDVVYAPPGVDFRSKSLAHGVRVFVEGGDAANVVPTPTPGAGHTHASQVGRRLEILMASYSKANPGLRAEGPYSVEPGLNRASVSYSNAPADDPTSRETGWIMVARLAPRSSSRAGGRWLCLVAVMPEAEKARNAEAFTRIRASLRVF